MTVRESFGSKETGLIPAKQSWEPLKLIYVGNVVELVRGGGGKLSMSGGDPGENRKQVSIG
jgi:hypothetical protein